LYFVRDDEIDMAKEKNSAAKQNGSVIAEGASHHQEAAGELTFEQSLGELELIVRKLEDGQLDMDEALAAYEQGLARLKRCHGLLAAAEQKVQMLAGIDAEGNAVVRPFEVEE
jgi:exodeoxyribonuclease VII small subunit